MTVQCDLERRIEQLPTEFASVDSADRAQVTTVLAYMGEEATEFGAVTWFRSNESRGILTMPRPGPMVGPGAHCVYTDHDTGVRLTTLPVPDESATVLVRQAIPEGFRAVWEYSNAHR